MKLCIPVNSPNGLESLLEPHLPRAEHLLFFDTETRSFEQISLRETSPGTGGDIEINAVLCGSINRVTLRTLIEQESRSMAPKRKPSRRRSRSTRTANWKPPSSRRAPVTVAAAVAAAVRANIPVTRRVAVATVTANIIAMAKVAAAAATAATKTAAVAAAMPRPAQRLPSGRAAMGSGIAVTSQNRKTVTEHAGKCRKFWIYDVRQGQVTGRTLLELPIEQSFHESPAGQAHPLDAVDVLITAGIGSGLQQRLQQSGIQSVVTSEEDPDQAVAVFLAGELERLSTATV